MNKYLVLDKIISILETELRQAAEAADQAHATATDDENVAENKYDTLGLEAAYLAHGQSRRVEELGADIKTFKSLPRRQPTDKGKVEVEVGTVIITTDESGCEQNLFMGPSAGGLKLSSQAG